MTQKQSVWQEKYISLEQKKQLIEAVHMKKVRRNIKVRRCVGGNVHGKVIEKLEFIENA